jgi:hypothetical protein
LIDGRLAALALLACATPAAPTAGTWRTDKAWNDGRAEKCVYAAARTIYGKPRAFRATAYTDKERVDPRTTCKSEADEGVEVFKHHWSEVVPTENYDYRFSTMTYTRTADMRAFKLTASTQEDCGASFKECWRDGDAIRWTQSVYFPGAGRAEGSIAGDAVFFDALTLALRDYDFEKKAELKLSVVPMQKDTHAVPFQPELRVVRFVATSEQELPIGTLRAHELELVDAKGGVEARFWFAADATAPMLHTLVRFEGPQGIGYRLESIERSAYWKR